MSTKRSRRSTLPNLAQLQSPPEFSQPRRRHRVLVQEPCHLLQSTNRLIQLLLNKQSSAERKVEGIQMPKYSGKIEESFKVFAQKVSLYLGAKNIASNAPENQARIIAMIASNLQGQAAMWYSIYKEDIKTVDQLYELMEKEFVPTDLQERLRDKLYGLKQRDCKTLEEYIYQFRCYMSQIEQMTMLDKVTNFCRGLVQRTREAVMYRRPSTYQEAISEALEYERTHPFQPRDNRSRGRNGYGNSHGRPKIAHKPREETEPMEIDTVKFSKQECLKQRLCFGCHKPGHQLKNCPNKKKQVKTVTMTEIVSSDREDEDDDEYVCKYELNVAQVLGKHISLPKPKNSNALMIKEGVFQGKKISILFDSGADHNIMRQGLFEGQKRLRKVNIEGFDGFVTKNVKVAHIRGDLRVDQRQFKDLPFVEIDLPSMNYDVILGKPWFTAYNPQINWREHTIESVESDAKRQAPVASTTSVEEPRKYFLVKASRVVNDELPPYVQELLLEFEVVCPDAIPPGLPPKRDVEFEITLKPDAKPSNRAPFRLSKMEEEALDQFVQELLSNKWIELSNSPWVSNVFGIPKKDPKTGKFPSRKEWLTSGKIIPIRWVIDYRYLNQNTEIPRIPLPNMNTIFDKMVHAVVFTTMDLLKGYHQMGVKPESRKYTAFRSKNETYQWCVAPMGVAGMPSIWSRLMNQLFGHLPFVVVYLDDLCIFSRNHEEHAQHLRIVFEILKKNQLYIKKSKCAFARSSVEFLGHMVSAKGVQMDERKVSAIVNWPTPRTLKEVQSFLGLAGYYRRFIPQFAEIARPLSQLAKKSVVFSWTSECTKAFQVLKTALQQAPVLRLPDFEKRFVVATDASKHAIGGVLSQQFEDGMHPVAYFSKTLGKHELNWSTYEKELFAIKMALEKWRHYLYGVEFDVYTDNSACSWFLQQSGVTGRLARWLVFFSQYNFRIHHLKGT